MRDQESLLCTGTVSIRGTVSGSLMKYSMNPLGVFQVACHHTAQQQARRDVKRTLGTGAVGKEAG